MLTKRIYLLIFILCIILFYFCIRENIFNYTSTLKSRKPEDVRSLKDQSNTEFQVVSQNKKIYTEEIFQKFISNWLFSTIESMA